MARSPIVPANLSDPGGFDRLERRAIKDFTRRMKAALAAYLDMLGRIDFNSYEVNRQRYTYELIVNEAVIPEPGASPQFTRTPIANAKRYEFSTRADILASMMAETGNLIDELLLQGGERSLWFTLGYVLPAYEQGAAQSWRNLGVQSAEYAVQRPSLESLLFSEPYQRRLALVRAREFELMKGLTATVKQQLAENLTAGLAQGIGPREIAQNLTAQTGVEIRRAERIARTEIGQALRTARLDEATDAAVRLGVQLRMMHLSALSPTTRLTHAERHGLLYPVEAERDWFAAGSNSINCKCSMTEVLVGADGQPLSRGLLDRTATARDNYLERQNAE